MAIRACGGLAARYQLDEDLTSRLASIDAVTDAAIAG